MKRKAMIAVKGCGMEEENSLTYWLAAEKFYEVLFEKLPDIETKFGDKPNQKTMFIVALRSIGDCARGDGQLADYMKMLGAKHRGYGLTEQHMEIGRQAFEQAIEVGGGNLNSQRKQRYLDAFTELERMMGFEMDVAKES